MSKWTTPDGYMNRSRLVAGGTEIMLPKAESGLPPTTVRTGIPASEWRYLMGRGLDGSE